MHPYASPLCIIMHLPCASLCISIVHPYASPLCVLIISLFHAHPLCIPTSSGPARSNRYSGWPGATCPAPTSSSCRSPSGGPRPAAATPMENPAAVLSKHVLRSRAAGVRRSSSGCFQRRADGGRRPKRGCRARGRRSRGCVMVRRPPFEPGGAARSHAQFQ